RPGTVSGPDDQAGQPQSIGRSSLPRHRAEPRRLAQSVGAKSAGVGTSIRVLMRLSTTWPRPFDGCELNVHSLVSLAPIRARRTAAPPHKSSTNSRPETPCHGRVPALQCNHGCDVTAVTTGHPRRCGVTPDSAILTLIAITLFAAVVNGALGY